MYVSTYEPIAAYHQVYGYMVGRILRATEPRSSFLKFILFVISHLSPKYLKNGPALFAPPDFRRKVYRKPVS